MNRKLFKRKLWEGLSVGSASLLVIAIGGYGIASAQATAINGAIGTDTSTIERSDDEQYQYFKSDFKGQDYSKVQAYFEETAEKVEAEGLVLLKNDNAALPLAKTEKVSTMFTGSNHFGYNSTGSSAGSGGNFKTWKEALSETGLSVNQTMWDYYEEQEYRKLVGSTTYKVLEEDYGNIPADTIATLDEYSTVICTITRSSGEGQDITAKKSDTIDGSYLTLHEGELQVLQHLKELKDAGKVKKVIVVLNSSATIQLDFLSRDDVSVDACLWVGNVGSSGISAVAKTLVGDYNPSGKLSDTYVKNSFASPAAAQLKYAGSNYSFAQVYNDSDDIESSSFKYYGVYSEGIYVGYRYFETRYLDYVQGNGNAGDYDYSADVAYPFGYGLGYASFEYSDFSVTKTDSGFAAKVTVTNTDKTYSGKDSALVYVEKPYTEYDKANGVEKAAVELVGYSKTTKELAPGESEELTINITKDQLKSYDYKNAKTYIEETGDYYFATGNGSHEAINNILALNGSTPANTSNKMDATGDATLAAKIEITDADIGDYAIKPTEAGSKYAKSVHSGNEITNKFEEADLNNFVGEGTITYVSRNDWVGTMPKSSVTLSMDSKMREAFKADKAYTEEEGLEMPKYGEKYGLTIASLRGKDYDDPQWEDLLNQMSYADQTNLIVNGQYQTAFIGSVGKPNTKEADGPTGYSDSKAGLSFPSEGIWASSFNNELVAKVGDVLAEECIAHNVTGLYANGVNIHRMPFGGRSHEYFSEDPFLTGSAGAAEVNGLQAKGVIAHVKHLAFNDEEAQRNGIAVWLNEQAAREIYLTPFEYTLSPEYGNSHAVMTSFNRIGGVWAGAHKGLITVLRDEFAFDGYSITDMASSNGASYMTYQDGILNATDVFLGAGTDTSLDKFKNSPTYAHAMRRACHKILYSVANYSVAMNGISSSTAMSSKTPWWQSLIIGLEIGAGVLTAGFASLWAVSLYLENKKD